MDENYEKYIVASELNDPIWHSLEWQIGSFSSEATIWILKRHNQAKINKKNSIYILAT